MPIRTNRGRAAVYRRLWGWPLRSPRHLIALVVFVLAVVLFLSTILPRVLSGPQATQNTAAGASVSGSPASGSPTPTQGAPGVVPPPAAGSGPGGSPGQSPSLTETRLSPSQNLTPARADPKAVDTAARWAEAFVHHPDGISAQDWLNPLRDLTTEEYFAARLSTIDPKAIAASRIRGGPMATAESYTSSVTVEIPTDAKKLRITVIRTSQGWRVNEHTEVE